jgi:guanylate kinase
MIDEGAFLEYMHVFNMHYYGTPMAFSSRNLPKGAASS